METGALDNANAANNLFGGGNANGAEILTAQKDDFLHNITEGFKQNGGAAIASPTNDPFSAFDRPANGKRPVEHFDEDEDMGPETDIDAVDDLPSPTKVFHDNRMDGGFNPFTDIDENMAFEMDLHLQKQQTSDFEVPTSPREETPTPPAHEVHDAAVEENVGDSAEESEDEWNYFKGTSAATENSPSKTDQEVAEINKAVEDIQEEDDDMSQLNPNAAEFVPVASPTRNVASPACRALINDEVIAQSPRRATPSDIDINLPNPQDFESEVKSRPSELFNNSHESENGHKLSSQEVMENLLNGRNIEEIEFHPSTPSKNSLQDEFHFGPNAAPFSTPGKFLDQSEAALSTKAVFGDESTASYLDGKNLEEGSFVDSFTVNQSEESQIEFKPKEQDPMSMSFYQDENDDTNPFDLNKVQPLPVDVDEFIGSSEIGEDDVKENIKPTEEDDFEDQLLGVSKLPKTPEPEICRLDSPTLEEVAKEPLPITPEPTVEECREETDLCNLSSPPQDLLFEENVCDIKKPSVDSSPETEELSQISDAGDDVPNLCQSPDVVKDFEQFESDIKDVCQFSAESNVEDVLRNFCGTQVPPVQEEYQMSTDTKIEDDFAQFPPKDDDFCKLESDVSEQPKEDICQIESEPEKNLSDLPELKKEEIITMPSETLVPTLGDADFFAPKPMEASPLSLSPEPDNELICKLSEQTTEQLAKSPEPTSEDFAKSPEPTTDLLDKSFEPTREEFAVSPEPTREEFAVSPEPTGEEFAKSPEPATNLLGKTFEPTTEEFAVSLEPTREEFAKSPEPISEELAKSPEPLSEELAKSPEPILEEIPKSTEPDNEALAKSTEPSNEELAKSTEPSNEELAKSTEPIIEDLVKPTELNNEELAKSPEPLVVAEDFSQSEVRPTDLDFLPDESKEIDSPMEDITSSVKDDFSSEIIEEAKDIATEKETTFISESIVQDVSQEVIEPPKEISEENICMISTPKSMAETESIATTDLNSFLDRSSLVELTSPLSPPSQLMDDISTEVIKTDIIAPQFAEEATILTPSTETPPAEIKEEVPAPLPDVGQDAEIKKEEIIAAGATAVAVAAVAAATVASTAKPDKKPLKSTPGKPTTTLSSAKKTPTKPATRTTPVPSKTTTQKPLAKTPTTTKPASPMKAPVPKTSTTRVPSTMRTTTTTMSARPAAAPKPATKVPAEKKPLMNGDAKPIQRTGLVKRTTTTTTTTRPTTTATSRPTTARLSPTKPSADKSLTKPAPRPTSLMKTTLTTAAPKPRPTTLSSTAARPAAPIAKSTLTKTSSATSPRTATAKPRPATAPAMPRPRPASLPKAKTPDTEKQIKDSANKLLTSRATTTRSIGSATARTTTTTTTLKKTEVKAPTRTTTTTKTTVTSIKSTKKPVEITRLAAMKTKASPTKTTKPQANGLTNGVSRTVVQETTAILSAETELIKDLSPVENKFLLENTLTQDSKVAD